MHLLIKWYYWYKNLWDELIIFSLLNRVDERFSPNRISIECWDEQRLESWIIKHKSFLIPGIIEKLEFLPKPNRKEKIKICLWMKRKSYDFIILWWWEVIDESRNFLYRWWNFFFQYRWSIKKWNTIIIGGLWTNNKRWTYFLQKFLIKNAKFIIIRDKTSYELAKNILIKAWLDRENRIEYDWDLSLPLLQEAHNIFIENKISNKRNKYYLINMSPLCSKNPSLISIKKFADSKKESQPIYIACNKLEDQDFYKNIIDILPQCEIFDWTQSNILEILKLFYCCQWWIWARLHFLFILKIFDKQFIKIHNSHKIEANLSDLNNE